MATKIAPKTFSRRGFILTTAAVSGGMVSATLSPLAVVIAGSLGCDVPGDCFSGCSVATLSVAVAGAGAAGAAQRGKLAVPAGTTHQHVVAVDAGGV